MEQDMKDNDFLEIDIWELISVVLGKVHIIILAMLIGGGIFFAASKTLLTPTYESTTCIYVLNKQDTSMQAITTSDLQTSSYLLQDYMALVTRRPVMEGVAKKLKLDISYKDMVEKIKVSSPADTRFINITASDKDPALAKKIADEVRIAVSEQIIRVMDVETVNVVEEGNLPEKPSKPSNKKNAVIGALLGFILTFGFLFFRVLLDDKIKYPDDIERYLGLSVLGVIPMDAQMKKSKKASPKKSKGKKK